MLLQSSGRSDNRIKLRRVAPEVQDEPVMLLQRIVYAFVGVIIFVMNYYVYVFGSIT